MCRYNDEAALLNDEDEITRAEARDDVTRNGADWEEFLAIVGDRPFYRGGDVMAWLGYR